MNQPEYYDENGAVFREMQAPAWFEPETAIEAG